MTTGPDRSRGRGEALEPGAAVAAVLVEHVWASPGRRRLAHGGQAAGSELVDAATLGELTADVIAAAARSGEQD